MGFYTYRNESTNITVFESDGTMRAYGDATVFEDKEYALVGSKLYVPGSKIVANEAESSLTFKTACPITDYVTMNVQMPHARKPMSAVHPHIHWWQGSSNKPNWYIVYRWQYNGGTHSTTWTQTTRLSEAFTYSAGTLNQITQFTAIADASTGNVSDILQFRVTRDSNNTSSSFGSTDVYSGDVDGTNFDVHVELDMLGSHSEYAK